VALTVDGFALSDHAHAGDAAAATAIDRVVINSHTATFGSKLKIGLASGAPLSQARTIVRHITDSTDAGSVNNGVLTVRAHDSVVSTISQGAGRAHQGAAEGRGSLTKMAGGATPAIFDTPPPVGSTGYHNIHCDVDKLFSDSDGSFGVQRKCGSGKAPWRYTFSPGLASICRDPVTERGLDWWVNAHRKPRQAPHIVPCVYVFHGTFTVGKGDYLWYTDRYLFQVQVDQETGDAELDIHGGLRFIGPAG